MFSMMTSSFTSTFLFLLSSLKCQIIIRDLRAGCGRWVVYVFMRGGAGSVARLSQDLFSKPNTVADFSLFLLRRSAK